MQPYCIYLRKSRADMEAEAHGVGENLPLNETLKEELPRREPCTGTEI